MTSSLSSTSTYVAGPSVPIPDDDVFTYCFSNPFQHAPSTNSKNHTYDGQVIPPQRPSIVHAGTGATLSWQRARADSLRVARYLRAIIGEELPWDGRGGKDPIHAPQTTILLHLPNCVAFPLLLLGAAANLYAVTPISPMLMPAELANILAKARPQVLVTVVGADGEDKLRKGLQVLLDRPEEDVGTVSGKEVKRWATQLASSWDQGKRQKVQKGDRPPVKEQRVWTVNLSTSGGADYYGTSGRNDGISTLTDPRDWSNLLHPPHGHKHSGSSDSLGRDAFQVRKVSKDEQVRRVFLLLWSSGTTGGSKGVLLSHRNLVASIVCSWYCNPQTNGPFQGPYGGGETWIALAPWCHVMGMATLLLPTFALGVTLIIPASPKFDLGNYLRLATKYRATKLHIAPPVAIAMRSTPLLDRNTPEGKEIDLSSVRAMMSGGAPTPTEVVKVIYQRTGIPLQIGYGATETGSNNNCEAVDITSPAALEELGSVGAAFANVEICVRPTPETSEEQTRLRFEEVVEQGKTKMKAGECAPMTPCVPGEILIRGDCIMLGYYSGLGSDTGGAGAIDVNLSTPAMTSDGYYRTGDEGTLDSKGRLWIVGRTKELIKVKGFQVAPAELDSLFAKHPEILDAGATGVAEADGVEQVVMYIIPRDEKTLKDAGLQKDLAHRLASFVTDKIAHYKWPKYYVFTPTVLKNPTGKIMRKELHTLKGTRHLAPRQDRQSKM
ncbi:hypothetical protein CBS101457_002732 [Exobasidium rhododendri]|nr:hypothetical protein CBS101457_002732 [Exobasidium rhododendri]